MAAAAGLAGSSGAAARLPPPLARGDAPRQRAVVAAAAGRRRRQTSAAPEPADEGALDLDDVMYGGDDALAGEGELLALDDGAAEEPQAPEFDEEDEEEEEEEHEYLFGDEDEDEEAADEGEAEDGWDAALADFDAAQDAAPPPAPPTKEEQERAAALALVRYDEDDAESGSTLEVSDAPPPHDGRPKTFEEQVSQLAPADREALVSNRQAYASFPMDDVDLLVQELPDGCMVGGALLAPADVPDRLPRAPARYQLIPWEHTRLGDSLKRVDTTVTLMRMYFVPVARPGPDYALDFAGPVFSFDAARRAFEVHDVLRLGGAQGGAMDDPVLRIREDGVFVEDSSMLPSKVLVAEGFIGHPSEQYSDQDKPFNIRDHVRMGLWPEPECGPDGRAPGDAPGGAAARDDAAALGPGDDGGDDAALAERLEELELMEELDDMPDVPAVDMV
ncbi:hypothetical protein HT031_005678 [Scenedesmus sp. PABB004]|nr:hypothetical protein HT031_005678 [Scenedesmus sp. PABB004]